MAVEEGPLTGGTASATCLSISGLVAEHVHAFCAPSPNAVDNAVDVMQRQFRSGEFEEALVLSDVVEAFVSFQNHHPEVQISLRKFRQLLPWNMRAPAEVARAGQPRERRIACFSVESSQQWRCSCFSAPPGAHTAHMSCSQSSLTSKACTFCAAPLATATPSLLDSTRTDGMWHGQKPAESTEAAEAEWRESEFTKTICTIGQRMLFCVRVPRFSRSVGADVFPHESHRN